MRLQLVESTRRQQGFGKTKSDGTDRKLVTIRALTTHTRTRVVMALTITKRVPSVARIRPFTRQKGAT